MQDVLHILELLKRQAEARLATSTKRKADALGNIDKIKENIVEMGQKKTAQTDALAYEHWCTHQRLSLSQIEAALPILDEDIRNAFKALEIVQAKVTAAADLAKKQQRAIVLKAEAAEEDAMLELSLLRRASWT